MTTHDQETLDRLESLRELCAAAIGGQEYFFDIGPSLLNEVDSAILGGVYFFNLYQVTPTDHNLVAYGTDFGTLEDATERLASEINRLQDNARLKRRRRR